MRIDLRNATRESHHVIDHHPLVAPLVRADLGLDDYVRALRGQLRIHRSLQGALTEALLTTGADYRLADRAGWLTTDLESLGFNHDASLPAWQPPPIEDATSLAGVLYVIEGSTLGGQVIARRVEASLGLTARHGARFFNGWGADTESRWQAFWRFAEGVVGSNTAAATAAAVATFEAIRRGFDEFLRSEEANPVT